MSWRDRDYNQDENSGRGMLSPLAMLFFGTIPMGRLFGIRIRLHASMLWFIGWVVLVGPLESKHFHLVDALTSMGILFTLVILHEFGHCFTARAVGGSADEILLSPLGGLATANPPHKPWPAFLTVAGGPAVNVVVCLITGAALWTLTGGMVPLNPFNPIPPISFLYTSVAYYLWWIFSISYILLLFNLLPIFPLDGGRILQIALWPSIGYSRSTNFACLTGMGGAILLAMVGITSGQLLLVFVAISGFLYCHQRRLMLKEMGSDGLDEVIEQNAGFGEKKEKNAPRPHRRLSHRAIRKIQKHAKHEQDEQAHIDAILDKVSAHGMPSLTWRERRALHKATERQRQRDLEFSSRSDDD